MNETWAYGPWGIQEAIVWWAKLHQEAAVPWFEPTLSKTQDVQIVGGNKVNKKTEQQKKTRETDLEGLGLRNTNKFLSLEAEAVDKALL